MKQKDAQDFSAWCWSEWSRRCRSPIREVLECLGHILVGGCEGHESCSDMGTQLQLGHESHCGSASSVPDVKRQTGWMGTISAVLVFSSYPDVSPAGRWEQRGIEQGHVHGCSQGHHLWELWLCLYMDIFAFGCSVGHRPSAASLLMGMICLREVDRGIFWTALSFWLEVSGGVGFPLLFLGYSSFARWKIPKLFLKPDNKIWCSKLRVGLSPC